MQVKLHATKWNLHSSESTIIACEPHATGRRKKPRIKFLNSEADFLPLIEDEIKELETNPKYYDSIEHYNKGEFGGFGGMQYATSREYKHIYETYLNPLKELLSELKEGMPFRELNIKALL
jgi:hypothetical protein